ncbi:MAG: hypothetical protein HMLKMBBP_01971 [Planctomycetes bacterium]|nr:hypothetical protein [Planctomycetota bacterium]
MSERSDEPMVLPLEPSGVSRRSFLRAAGYGATAAALAACTRAPERAIVSGLSRGDVVAPGRPYFIATTCGACPAACGVLARCVDGRPVKLEGLPGHPVSDGGLCAVGQAQVLSLYDSHRTDGARTFAVRGGEGAPAAWDAPDAAIRARLDAANGKVVLLTGPVTSPSTLAWIAKFRGAFGAEHVMYEPGCASAVADAHAATHGLRVVPRFDFSRARVVASFGADFLGAWLSPVEHARDWSALRPGRTAPERVSKHWQIESRVSTTGLRADRRVRIAPWEAAGAVTELAGAVAGNAPTTPWIAELAAELLSARGASLVISDDPDPAVQSQVNALNVALENYGATVRLEEGRDGVGSATAVRALLARMKAGEVAALVVAGCNPGHAFPGADGFAAAAAKVGTVAVIAPMPDETTAAADFLVPEAHALESWDDAMPARGVVSLRQPAIVPLRAARTLRECLARWCGDSRKEGALVRDHWRDETDGGRTSLAGAFERAFDAALERGHFEARAGGPWKTRVTGPQIPAARARPDAGHLAFVAYEKTALRDGAQAHNAWLQELPDPVSKCVWDNYACLSPDTAKAMGVETGDVVRITVGAASVELPALVQRGQHDGAVAVALGYGRMGTGRFSDVGPEWLESRPTVAPGGLVGVNAAALLPADREPGATVVVRVERTGAKRALACTQDHHTLHVPAHLAPHHGEVRDAVRTIAPGEIGRAAKPEAHAGGAHGGVDLWPADHAATGPKWGMVVDLAACSGCSACVVACQAENSVPVVGKDEVLRHREMHWIRIDRYYDGPDDGLSASQQPMMCQHCANAPCETVCPVLATVHSSDGLNQQVYNRCVGTRYCANNCPYKVRRFNWFDYPREDALQNLALNPDVTVRTRGVMEKCSLCVQRIQEWRNDGRAGGPPMTACQQSCPAGAIVFGDLNDPESRVAKLARDGRAYQVLGELNVKPVVSYLADVRRKDGGGGTR